MLQHQQHQMADITSDFSTMKGSLCEKHCVPDSVQKELQHPPIAALPGSITLAAVMPLCAEISGSEWVQSPPATGPPATIRFCRFRE